MFLISASSRLSVRCGAIACGRCTFQQRQNVLTCLVALAKSASVLKIIGEWCLPIDRIDLIHLACSVSINDIFISDHSGYEHNSCILVPGSHRIVLDKDSKHIDFAGHNYAKVVTDYSKTQLSVY